MEEDLFKAFEFAKGMSGGMKIDPAQLLNRIALESLRALHKELGTVIAMMEKPGFNPFIILGIDPNATKEEVRKAYRDRAKDFHPDVQGGDTQKMTELNLARDLIFKLRGWA